MNYYLIVDCHNASIKPENDFLYIIRTITGLIHRLADLTIVTNDRLSEIIKKNNGRPIVLPDKLPNCIEKVTSTKLKGSFNIVCISTFGLDEPYIEVIKAANILPNDIYIFMTGDYKKLRCELIENSSKNIIFTGYIDDHEYWKLLSNVDAVMDLTHREDCLVCGAYEAISVNKPIILSDTLALRQYFYKGTVFTKNESFAIANSIKFAKTNIEILNNQIISLKEEIDISWSHSARELMKAINSQI
jgi:glycosyltransferase involved in cell wall biosynthesis